MAPGVSQVLRHLDAVAVLAREPPAARGDDEDDGEWHRIVEGALGLAEPALHEGVLHEHLAGHIAEQAAAEPDDPGETVHEMGEQAGPPYDDGKRGPAADKAEQEAPMGGAGEGRPVATPLRAAGAMKAPGGPPADTSSL